MEKGKVLVFSKQKFQEWCISNGYGLDSSSNYWITKCDHRPVTINDHDGRIEHDIRFINGFYFSDPKWEIEVDEEEVKR